ncbi:MAG: alpha/beta hydrolase [Calditrichaeota bacterium]|nr:MAG: alpha/beta hydrolase [Calditrichota bacterium]MBL1207319.1 alpha/beta hydrolase [Calditrichota bacterium]NOG47151.1 alpha/beta hydrolase [Calditrichota bacterium]
MMTRPINKFSHPIRRAKTAIGDNQISYLYIDQNFDNPIIFLHGIPSSAELWREIMVLTSKDNFGVYAPDLAGYGKTRLPKDGDYSLAGSAELIAEWIKKKFGKAVWIVGHDIGGAVAQILAVTNPELVKRLTLCNSPMASSFPVLPVKIFKALAKLGLYTPIAKAGLVPNPYTISKMKAGFFDSDILSKEKIKQIFWSEKLYNEEGRRQFSRHLKALNNKKSCQVADSFSNLSIPVQLIWAKNDHYQPWQKVGTKLEKAIPNTTTFLIEQAGHYLPIEKPAEFANALVRWHDSI